jgi:hypothetical protein
LLSKTKLYIYYNNVILVGRYNGLECYNHSYYSYYSILSFKLYLGSFRAFGLLISGLTELRLRTSRAAFCSKYSQYSTNIEELLFVNICVKFKFKLKLKFVKWLNGENGENIDLRGNLRRVRAGLRGRKVLAVVSAVTYDGGYDKTILK